MGCSSFGRRQSRSLHQQSHPTRVVAGVDILRHTSAHKGSPFFRRRAPAPNTVDPRGLLTLATAQSARRQETLRHRRKHLDQLNRGRRDSRRNVLLISRARHRAARRAHRCRRSVCWGVPRAAGGWPRRWKRSARRGDSSASGRLAGSSLLARRPTIACRAIDRQRSLAVRIAAA